jgi:hypothetical protein
MKCLNCDSWREIDPQGPSPLNIIREGYCTVKQTLTDEDDICASHSALQDKKRCDCRHLERIRKFPMFSGTMYRCAKCRSRYQMGRK